MRNYLKQIRTILWKDLLVEFRTRERLIAMGAFVVLVAILFNYSTDWVRVSPEDIASGLVWMTIMFAGLLGVGRTFHLEAEDGAFQGILMSPVPKDAIFIAKALANFVFLYIMALLVVGVFIFFFGLEVGGSFGMLTLVIALGVLAFVALGTLFTAVSTGTRMGDTLLPVLIFPLLAPVVIYGTSATSQFLAGRPVTEAEGSIRMLAAFALTAFFLGSWLFRFVVED